LALPSVNFRQKDRKKFDEMWDVPRPYVSACSNSVQLVPLHPIVISILFHHYKELKECISEVEQIMMEATATVNHKQVLKKKEERMEGRPQPLLTEGYAAT
jgi:hypothetical protein